MANRLHQVLSFANVAGGGNASLPHSLNVNAVALIPDRIFFDTAGFTATADATQVTVTNTTGGILSVDVWLEILHSELRVFGAEATTFLIPRPFVSIGGSAGGGSGTAQVFRYSASGAEGSDFFITLPAARASDAYRIQMTQAGGATVIGYSLPDAVAGDRTTTQFRVQTTTSLVSGHVFDIRVEDPT